MPHEKPDGLPDARKPDREDQRALPAQSQDETDIGWGELPETGEDDRFRRDRPPHWDSE